MTESTTLTVRLSKELEARLERLAADTGRSKSDLAALAIAEYIKAQAWQVEATGKAVEQADAGGPFIAHEDMAAYMKALARGERPEPPKGVLVKPSPLR